MNDRILHKLGFARTLLLTGAAALAIAIPVTMGVLTATPGRAQSENANTNVFSPAYTLVSIKLSESADGQLPKMMVNLNNGALMARGITLQRLIQLAYHVQDSQLDGGPDWVNTARFDIDAKLDPSVVAAMHKQIAEHNSGDLKALLADQFKLVVHSEARTLPAYDLVVDSGGPKLQEVDGIRMLRMEPGQLISQGTPIDLLALQLSMRLGRPIVDKTGLKGSYAFSLRWTPARSEQERMRAAGAPVPEAAAESNVPSLFTALEQQLGLKLEPHTEPVQVLVIDRAESPAGIL